MKEVRFLLLLLLFVSFVVSLVFTEVYMPFSRVLFPSSVTRAIVEEIKLPVVISAMLIGALLSMSGAIMQLLLRNPLMDPYVSGTASGGAFGAVLSYFLLAFGLPFGFLAYVSPLVAFSFSMVSTLVTLIIGRRGGVYALVIGGVIVGFIFSSLTTILVTLMSIKFWQLPSVEFWLFGEVVYMPWRDVFALGALTALLFAEWYRSARKMDLVSISDEMSYARRINPDRFRIVWVALISLVVSFAVSVAGIIGFVGIIVPHIVRRFGPSGSTRLVPYSALLGASFLVLANSLSSGILGTVIPLTALTALIAAPVMVYVLVRPYAR